MSHLAHRYTYTPGGDLVLILSPGEAIALDAMVGASLGAYVEQTTSEGGSGFPARVAAAERAAEVVRIAAGAGRQLRQVNRTRGTRSGSQRFTPTTERPAA
jgi:hypothetical protein